MLSAGFEPAIPAIEWLQIYALDRMASGMGCAHTVTQRETGVRPCLILYDNMLCNYTFCSKTVRTRTTNS